MNIAAEKRKIVTRIMKKAKPLMWESGFTNRRENSTSNLHICVFKREAGYIIKNAYNPEVNTVHGFTEEGDIICDTYYMIQTMPMKNIPYEELLKIEKIADKYLDPKFIRD